MKTTGLFDLNTNLSLLPSAVKKSVEQLATTDSMQTLGAVYTKPEVVIFMLDLIGYTSDHPLYTYKLLEPATGSGEFLFEAVRRLVRSCKKKNLLTAIALKECILAVELHRKTFYATRAVLISILSGEGIVINR